MMHAWRNEEIVWSSVFVSIDIDQTFSVPGLNGDLMAFNTFTYLVVCCLYHNCKYFSLARYYDVLDLQ